MAAELLSWLQSPLGQAVGATVGMATLGAAALALFGAECVDRYMPADWADRGGAPVDFNDTVAAVDSRPAYLSESQRVDQLLNIPAPPAGPAPYVLHDTEGGASIDTDSARLPPSADDERA